MDNFVMTDIDRYKRECERRRWEENKYPQLYILEVIAEYNIHKNDMTVADIIDLGFKILDIGADPKILTGHKNMMSFKTIYLKYMLINYGIKLPSGTPMASILAEEALAYRGIKNSFLVDGAYLDMSVLRGILVCDRLEEYVNMLGDNEEIVELLAEYEGDLPYDFIGGALLQ